MGLSFSNNSLRVSSILDRTPVIIAILNTHHRFRDHRMSIESKQTQIVTLTEENFGEYSAGEKPLFIDFWAVWCGPCRIMEPVVERLAVKYGDHVVFGKVNVDEQPRISSNYQVLSIPTFMVFKKGRPMDGVIGAVGEASLEQMLKRALNGQRTSPP